jgi:2-methylcitrate dehydratase PrpD
MSVPFLAERLAEFVVGTRLEDLPTAVVQEARRRVLDYLGVAICGSATGELSRIALPVVRAMRGHPECQLIFVDEKVPAAWAAFYNAIASHTIELDDGYRKGTVHPATAIIPPAMAVGERLNADLGALLRSVILGYEICLRVASAINPSHMQRGFHTTGTCGSLGAAVSVASIIGYDVEQVTHTLVISGLQSAGFQEMLHDNPFIKPLQPGKAAMAGVLSADLVAQGARGPRSLFEGRKGFFKGMSDAPSPAQAIEEGLGKRFEFLGCYTKPYPACRHVHPAIDLALLLRNRYRIASEQVARVTVRTYSVAISEVGQVWQPASSAEAMFSMPYAVATALCDGCFTLDSLRPDRLERQVVRDLARKVVIEQDPNQDSVYPTQRGANMTIQLADGREFAAHEDLPKGEPENPLSDVELQDKFSTLSERYIGIARARTIWTTVMWGGYHDTSCSDLLSLCQRKQDVR